MLSSGEGKGGTGGHILLQVGTGDSSKGGAVDIVSGDATQADGVGGYVNITAGDGTNSKSGRGGIMQITAGTGIVSFFFNKCGLLLRLSVFYFSFLFLLIIGTTIQGATGGNLYFHSGASVATSSGNVNMSTPNAGKAGISGSMFFSTGTTSSGSSGKVEIKSGVSTSGTGGDLAFYVGTGDSGNGGNLTLVSGETSAQRAVGGFINVTAGSGSKMGTSGGIGGSVLIAGGLAGGLTGGSIELTSGYGRLTTSGSIKLITSNAGATGVSGNILVRTGTSSSGDTGSISLSSSPPSVLQIDTLALEVADPYPPWIQTPPPVSVALEPDLRLKAPPLARFPLPTVMLTLPADPEIDCPVPI